MRDLGRYLDHARQCLDEEGFQRCCLHGGQGHVASIRDVQEFRQELELATDEQPMQRFLAQRPSMLTGQLGVNYRWAIPWKNLGGQFVPDFLTARLDSLGVSWTLVELESPTAKLFTKSGSRSRQLAKGIEQILEWRRWITHNRDFARRSKAEMRAGLFGISDTASGLLLIGRDEMRDDDNVGDRLRQLEYDHRIMIHSYDWLMREAEQRLAFD